MGRSPEEMQLLGVVGIFKESFEIIWKYKQILGLITITLILPLSLVFLVQIQISDYLYYKLYRGNQPLVSFQYSTLRYIQLSGALMSEQVVYCILKVVYYAILLVLSLLSTSVVVYLVAFIYTSRPVMFNKVLSVVLGVWKRLIVTFLWIFLISVVHNLFTLGLLVALFALFGYTPYSPLTMPIFAAVFLTFFLGYVYLCIVWQMASVISVLEEIYGIKAMVKAIQLIEGKEKVVAVIFLLLVSVDFGIVLVYQLFVAFEWNPAMIFGVGVVCLLMFASLFLLGLVVRSVTYFVCKSYPYQYIDKPALAEHLEAFLRDSRDVVKDIKVELPLKKNV